MSALEERFAVVGGGLLGMTLALRLAQAGRKVALYEAADHLGGLADAWQLGDVRWDRHYHVLLLSDQWTRRLLRELDLEHEIQWVETRTGFYCDGRLYSLSNSWEFLRFPPLSLFDKLRLAGTILYASRIRNWRRLEQIPVADWLCRLSGRNTWDKIWLPLLRAKLGEDYRHTSAAFIWATIARMYAARRTGLKKELFGYVPGGYGRIIGCLEAALAAAGVEIRTACPAVCVDAAHASGGRVRVDFSGGDAAMFDRVVITIPAPLVAQLCPGLTADERRRHGGIQYQGIVCASLLTRRPLSPFYVTNITDETVPFTGMIEMSALVDRRHFGGHSLIYLPKYVRPDDPLFRRSDANIESEFLSALERMHRAFRREDVLAFRVSRVRHVFPLPTLGYSHHVPPVQSSLPGVYVLNSAHIVNGTLNVNETVRLAESALPGLLGNARSGPRGAGQGFESRRDLLGTAT